MTRATLKRKIVALATSRNFKSVSPARDIALRLRKDLQAVGIPDEDHFIVVLNMMPKPKKTPKPVSTEELMTALEESVKLQSHYAILLNEWDGGQRITFANADKWIARLRKCKRMKP